MFKDKFYHPFNDFWHWYLKALENGICITCIHLKNWYCSKGERLQPFFYNKFCQYWTGKCPECDEIHTVGSIKLT